MTTLIWKDPGINGSARLDWPAIADELRAHPGEWAFVGRASTSLGSHIKTGRNKHLRPAGTFEATMRNTADGYGDLYVRYIGACQA